MLIDSKPVSPTLGPWVAEKKYNNGFNNVISIEHLGYAPRRIIAEIWADESGLSSEDWANARLLSAAPDLLSRLSTAASLIKGGILDHCTGFEVRQWEALIRRSRGGANEHG
jgi:hypothetical protein